MSASSTRRSLDTAARRASRLGVRGHQPDERPQRRPRLAEPGREQPDEQLGHRQHGELQRAQREAPAAGQRRHRAHPVAGPQHLVVEVGPPHGELLAMASPGLRGDDDAGPAEVGPPAQVDVVAVERDGAVEAAEGAEQVGAHEHAGRRQDEHVAHRVVLLLVELARLGDRVDLAEAVEAEPDVLEDRRDRPTTRASARRGRRSSGTAPRPWRGWRRGRGRRRRGRCRRTRCRPRRARAPRWRRRRSRGWRRAGARTRRAGTR